MRSYRVSWDRGQRRIGRKGERDCFGFVNTTTPKNWQSCNSTGDPILPSLKYKNVVILEIKNILNGESLPIK